MIEYIKGVLAELTPAYAVVETTGVGYGLNITLNTYTAIQGKKDVRLYVFDSFQWRRSPFAALLMVPSLL